MADSLQSPRTFEIPPATVRGQCAYCEGPLSPEAVPASAPGARYCCYGCRLLGESAAKPIALESAQTSPWFKIAVGAVLAGQAMLLGMAVNLAPPTGSARLLLHGALIASTFAVLAILGGPLVAAAREELRQRRITVELLFLAGLAGALGASLHSTLTGAGAVYYEVVGVLVTVYATGKTLGAQSRARALAETRQLHRTFEVCRRVAVDGAAESVRVTEVRTGDRVRVLAGEPIPIDGRVLEGQAFVCETPLTGEPFPVVRRTGDPVWAGSYSEDGELWIEATAAGTQRRLDGLLAALDSARERPCRIQAQADRLVRWFLPLVLGVSIATFAFWTARVGWMDGLYRALAVLLVACPCAMGLATPVALWSGLAALASRGLVLKSGDQIERLAATDEMVFDKTGTLSEERFALVDWVAVGLAAERREISAQLRAVQEASAHPVARAFHTPGESADSRVAVRKLKTVPGLGIEAWIESEPGGEHHLRVGARALMTHLGTENDLLGRLRHAPADRLVYVERDGRLCAIAAVNERLRDSARTTLRTLESLRLSCRILTGDRPEHAAGLLDAHAIQGGLTATEKAAQIDAWRRQGREVCFVGDGVNDAPALRAASLGIALAHGAGVTTAGADAVLYGGDLRVLPWAVALSRQVRSSIRSNLRFAAAYNLIGMGLAATGMLHPVAAALLMVVSSFTVSWRALRASEGSHACGLGPSTSPPDVSAPGLPVSEPRASTPSAGVGTGRLDEATAAAEIKSRRARLGSSLLIAAQIPFVIYLGRLSGLSTGLNAVGLLALALILYRWQPRDPEANHSVQMLRAMLGPGNWGMLLGWWADSGFGPARPCCMGAAGGGFDFSMLTGMPWMNAGMLLLGLPPMLAGPRKTYRGLGRVLLGVLSSIGMVLGMSYGGHIFLHWSGVPAHQGFSVILWGMTVGMLAGMVLACEFGRALGLAFRATPRWGRWARRRQLRTPNR